MTRSFSDSFERRGSANPDPDRLKESDRFLRTCVLAILVVAGAFAYERAFRTLHIDETWVAGRIRAGEYVPHGIPTPPLYFFSGVALDRVIGTNDVSLRVPAVAFLLLAIVTPLALRKLAADALTPRATLIWTFLIAFSSPYAYYGSRIKQYTAEAFVATVLVSLAMWVGADPSNRTRVAIFAGVGSLAAATSHCAPFVLLGTGCALGSAALVDSRGGRRPRIRVAIEIIAAHLVAAVVFLLAWRLYLSPGEGVERQLGDLSEYFSRIGLA